MLWGRQCKAEVLQLTSANWKRVKNLRDLFQYPCHLHERMYNNLLINKSLIFTSAISISSSTVSILKTGWKTNLQKLRASQRILIKWSLSKSSNWQSNTESNLKKNKGCNEIDHICILSRGLELAYNGGKTPGTSLSSKLVPVHYREYEYGLM